jgi:hypothetical protein
MIVDKNNLMGYQVKNGGSDGCSVYSAAKQYVIGIVGERLDGDFVGIKVVVLPG